MNNINMSILMTLFHLNTVLSTHCFAQLRSIDRAKSSTCKAASLGAQIPNSEVCESSSMFFVHYSAMWRKCVTLQLNTQVSCRSSYDYVNDCCKVHAVPSLDLYFKMLPFTVLRQGLCYNNFYFLSSHLGKNSILFLTHNRLHEIGAVFKNKMSDCK